ncbi:hypothetical protein V5H41_29915, partial [Salmonella enterica]
RYSRRTEKMEPFFPPGMKIVYPYDTTPFVKISIHRYSRRTEKMEPFFPPGMKIVYPYDTTPFVKIS